ncbi:MAG: hypothetical protein R2795_04595 [Saprospiraceae bacterium]
MLHCFSAGNHGNDPCGNPYSWLVSNANGAYYGTITGGRKSAKNVLAVGNLEWNDPTTSSRVAPPLTGG